MKKRLLIDLEESDHDMLAFIANWDGSRLKPFLERALVKVMHEEISTNKHFNDYYEIKNYNSGPEGDSKEFKSVSQDTGPIPGAEME